MSGLKVVVRRGFAGECWTGGRRLDEELFAVE